MTSTIVTRSQSKAADTKQATPKASSKAKPSSTPKEPVQLMASFGDFDDQGKWEADVSLRPHQDKNRECDKCGEVARFKYRILESTAVICSECVIDFFRENED